MTFKEFLKKWGSGSPFSRREGKFVLIGQYKFNPNIFYIGISLMIILLGCIFYSVGFNMNDQIYFKCNQVTPCENPFYKTSTVLEEKYKSKCVYSWCNDEYLQPGFEFGNKPSWIIQNFGILASLIMIVCLGINHFLHNKNIKWDLEE